MVFISTTLSMKASSDSLYSIGMHDPRCHVEQLRQGHRVQIQMLQRELQLLHEKNAAMPPQHHHRYGVCISHLQRTTTSTNIRLRPVWHHQHHHNSPVWSCPSPPIDLVRRPIHLVVPRCSCPAFCSAGCFTSSLPPKSQSSRIGCCLAPGKLWLRLSSPTQPWPPYRLDGITSPWWPERLRWVLAPWSDVVDLGP